MTEKIKVLQFKVGEQPKEVIIGHTLEEMQSLVGGWLECIEIAQGIDVWCNEEGKINRLPLNRPLMTAEGKFLDVIAGDFFIAGGNDEGETISLTDEQIEYYKNQLAIVME